MSQTITLRPETIERIWKAIERFCAENHLSFSGPWEAFRTERALDLEYLFIRKETCNLEYPGKRLHGHFFSGVNLKLEIVGSAVVLFFVPDHDIEHATRFPVTLCYLEEAIENGEEERVEALIQQVLLGQLKAALARDKEGLEKFRQPQPPPTA